MTWASLAKALKEPEGPGRLPCQASGQSRDLQEATQPRRGQLLTKDSIFPVLMAIADSRAPVVEKVQQLPQPP